LVVLLLAVVTCDFALVFFAFGAAGVGGGVVAAAVASSESGGGEHHFFTVAHCVHESAILPALTPVPPYTQSIHACPLATHNL
jgi:hypothetical protein